MLGEGGPGGSSTTHKSTEKNFLQLWSATVCRCDAYQHWEVQGNPSIAKRAAEIVAKRLAKAEGQTYISAAAEKAIAEIVDK